MQFNTQNDSGVMTRKHKKLRQWLHNNGASAIIDTIYEETPDNLKPTDRKKWTKEQKQKVEKQEMEDKIHEGQKEFLGNAFDTTMRSINVLGTPLDFWANQTSNGDYQTFGEFVRKGNDWGVAGNIGAEFLNPGNAIDLGIGIYGLGRGIKQGVKLAKEYTPVIKQAVKNTKLGMKKIGYALKNFPTPKKIRQIKNLEEWYTGVKHIPENFNEWKGKYMDEMFPEYNGTIWTSDSKDLARAYTQYAPQKDGKVYKVLVSKDIPAAETPKIDGHVFQWGSTPITKNNGKYELLPSDELSFKLHNGYGIDGQTKVTNITPKWYEDPKRLPSTNAIAQDAFEDGFQRVKIHNVQEDFSLTPSGEYYNDVVTDHVLAPHTPHFVLGENQSKLGLLFKNLDEIVVKKHGGIIKRK